MGGNTVTTAAEVLAGLPNLDLNDTIEDKALQSENEVDATSNSDATTNGIALGGDTGDVNSIQDTMEGKFTNKVSMPEEL